MQGTVNRIWHNQRADGSEYWVVSVDGLRYSTWDENLVRGIREGDTVEFAFNRSGRYRNLTALKRASPPPFTTADKLVPSPKSLRIVRMSCLRTAAEMVKDSTLLPEQKVSLVLTIAQRLEKHVLGTGETRSSPSPPGEHDDGGTDNRQEGKA